MSTERTSANVFQALEHDPDVMENISRWIQTEGERMVLIYGEYDPWSGGRIELGAAGDTHSFTALRAGHTISIFDLENEDREQVLQILDTWTGGQRLRSGYSTALTAKVSSC